MSYEGQQAEVVSFKAHNGDTGEAYYARPTRAGKVPGIAVIMHLPGWDEWIIEVARKFAHHGYAAIAPHLYFREGPGSPDDIGARVRAAGDPWAEMSEAPQSLEPLLGMHARDTASGLPDAAWPPVYPKMPGEPPRVAPSRAKKAPPPD